MMKFNRREKILAALAGTAVLLLAGRLLWGGDSRSLGQLRADRDRLAAEVEKKEARVQAVRRTAAQLTEWQRRALPADAAHGRSLYQNWLRALADRVGFRQLNIDSSEGQSRRNAFTLFTFTVRGRGELGRLTEFLYDFYAAGHLHQIRRLDVKPVEGSTDLDLTLSVEAISLPGADRKDRLSPEPGKRLKLAKLADYRDPIVGRNLFAVHTPRAEVASVPQAKPVDPAEFAFVTAILEADGRSQVWVVDRTAGKTLRLHEGEAIEVGSVHGRIKTIGRRDVVLEVQGRQRRLTSGDNLRGGVDVTP